MRLTYVLLSVPVLGLVGCGSGGGVTLSPTTPDAGTYQATLTGYSVQTCDASLVVPVGTLDAAARFGFVVNSAITFEDSAVWRYGQIQLAPAQDQMGEVFWSGQAQTVQVLATCTLAASIAAQYTAKDPVHGTLTVRSSFSADAGAVCASPKLPCEADATWALVFYSNLGS